MGGSKKRKKRGQDELGGESSGNAAKARSTRRAGPSMEAAARPSPGKTPSERGSQVAQTVLAGRGDGPGRAPPPTVHVAVAPGDAGAGGGNIDAAPDAAGAGGDKRAFTTGAGNKQDQAPRSTPPTPATPTPAGSHSSDGDDDEFADRITFTVTKEVQQDSAAAISPDEEVDSRGDAERKDLLAAMDAVDNPEEFVYKFILSREDVEAVRAYREAPPPHRSDELYAKYTKAQHTIATMVWKFWSVGSWDMRGIGRKDGLQAGWWPIAAQLAVLSAGMHGFRFSRMKGTCVSALAPCLAFCMKCV